MTHKKVQKLCYYAQAWHYTLLNEPLFPEEIQAWVHGPVAPSLYPVYADYKWNDIPQTKNNDSIFCERSLDLLNKVYDTYGEFSGEDLEALTHSEDPWKIARGDLKPWEICTNPISLESMKVYYGKLYEENQND